MLLFRALLQLTLRVFFAGPQAYISEQQCCVETSPLEHTSKLAYNTYDEFHQDYTMTMLSHPSRRTKCCPPEPRQEVFSVPAQTRERVLFPTAANGSFYNIFAVFHHLVYIGANFDFSWLGHWGQTVLWCDVVPPLFPGREFSILALSRFLGRRRQAVTGDRFGDRSSLPGFSSIFLAFPRDGFSTMPVQEVSRRQYHVCDGQYADDADLSVFFRQLLRCLRFPYLCMPSPRRACRPSPLAQTRSTKWLMGTLRV